MQTASTPSFHGEPACLASASAAQPSIYESFTSKLNFYTPQNSLHPHLKLAATGSHKPSSPNQALNPVAQEIERNKKTLVEPFVRCLQSFSDVPWTRACHLRAELRAFSPPSFELPRFRNLRNFYTKGFRVQGLGSYSGKKSVLA